MTLYICTVGTSIAGRPAAGVAIAQRIGEHLDARRREHAGDPRAFLIAAAAETNVLARRDCGPADEVLLLASDTDDGRACAESLRGLIFENLDVRARIEAITGLQVGHEARFREEGLRNLVRKARAAARDARARGQTPVFNVTGGYKGVVPYLTLLGMFEGAEILYVYQEIDALIRLPALPVRMATELIAPALPMLSALAEKGVMAEATFDQLARRAGWAGEPTLELLFEREGGMVAVSAAGELALEAPVPSLRAGRLRIHPKAGRHGDNPLVDTAIESLNVPDLRRAAKHRDRHSNTDLLIWKTYDGSAPRLFYWTEGDDIWLADILRHDEYERTVLVGPGLWRKDYDVARFAEKDLTAQPDDRHGAALAAFVDGVEAEAEAAIAEAKVLRAELEKARASIHRLERQ